MSPRGILKWDLTPAGCPWLRETVPMGTVVYKYHGYTYGCVSDEGVAVSLKPDEPPFFEVPVYSVFWETP